MLRSINNNIWRGSNIALDSIFCCKFEYSLLWRLLSLTHWCWSLEAEGGDSLDADLAVEALEGGVHGGGGEAVAQGAPVHTAYTGQVISLVGIHTSSQGGAQTRS